GSNREYWWDQLERLVLGPGRLPPKLRLVIEDRMREWDLGSAADYTVEEFERYRRWRPWEPAPTPRQRLHVALYQALNPLPESERRRVAEDLRMWAGAGPEGRASHRAMKPDEVHAMAGSDLLEIGAHTVTHPCLASQPPAVQRQEILQSKARLEELSGRPVTSF